MCSGKDSQNSAEKPYLYEYNESTRVKHHANPETVDDPYFYYETVKRTIASFPHRDK